MIGIPIAIYRDRPHLNAGFLCEGTEKWIRLKFRQLSDQFLSCRL